MPLAQLALILPLVSMACGALKADEIPSSEESLQPNVLPIVLDTTRKVDFRILLNEGVIPFLAQLDRGGVSYPNTHAHSSWTEPNYTALFTSLYSAHRQPPHEHPRLLEADPKETQNQAFAFPQEVSRLQAIADTCPLHETKAAHQEISPIDDEAKAALRALGYGG